MAKLFLLCFIFISINHAFAQYTHQKDSSLKYLQLNEVVISANRFIEKKKNVAQKIDILTSGYIKSVSAQNTGDLLMSTGNVFVQKSQQGGSSPVIRGFEASRVLLIVDGVRMNNAIYRSGHLQNVISVDQNMLERIEIMYGPSSTLYGSDALGGVINFRTRSPRLADSTGNYTVHAGAFTRFSSANKEKTVHADMNIGLKKIGFLSSFTFSDFGDMRMGGRFSDKYPDFGKRQQYIADVSGQDSVVINHNDLIQKYSGYRQWDFTQKVLFKPGDKTAHSLNFQWSNSTDIPRYDRLQDIRNGTLRYARWYYGPQKRNLYAYEFSAEKLTGFFSDVKANLNYQHIEESRHTREYRRYDRLDSRRERINVAGITLDARKTWGNNELNVGADGQLNDLKSVGIRTNISTGAISKIDSRYPDGENNMSNFAVFGQHTLKMFNGKLVLNDGLRLQATSLHATIVDTAIQLHLPYTDIKQHNMAVTGNIGLVFNPDDRSKISGVVSSGFRSPNIDDLSKIFESSTSARQLLVPNPVLKPEFTYNIDMSISRIFNDKFKLEITGFYTLFKDAIVAAPFMFNGKDSVVYQGVQSQVLAHQNKNRAHVYGFNAGLSANITSSFTLVSNINFTRGKYEADDTKLTNVYKKQPDNTYKMVSQKVTDKPLDHIPPVFGKTSLLYHSRTFSIEFFMFYNGWKKLDAYNPDGEDNAQYATPEGTPSWFTCNVRAVYKVDNHINLQAGIDNIADKNYRSFASGFSAPGRNFTATLRAYL